MSGQLEGKLAVKGVDPRTMDVQGSLAATNARIPIAPTIGTMRDADVQLSIANHVVQIEASGKLGHDGTLKLSRLGAAGQRRADRRQGHAHAAQGLADARGAAADRLGRHRDDHARERLVERRRPGREHARQDPRGQGPGARSGRAAVGPRVRRQAEAAAARRRPTRPRRRRRRTRSSSRRSTSAT